MPKDAATLFAPVVWPLAHGRSIELGPKAVIMGVLNVTPDSFSDGGRFEKVEAALAQARRMTAEGAAIVDVGGESTRPGAAKVDASEEQRRILPVIEALAAGNAALISVDTYRAETARLAVAAGAHIVNDVWGLQREPDIARVAAGTGAGLVIMHTGRGREKLADPVADQKAFLSASLAIARAAGADHLIDSDSADLRAELRALGGVDVVYDAIGGETFMAALRATRPEGRLIPIGFAGGTVPQIPANLLLVKNLTVIGLYWGGYAGFRPEVPRSSLAQLLDWYRAGRLHPHVSHSLPLARAAEALALLQERRSTGKVVVTIGGETG